MAGEKSTEVAANQLVKDGAVTFYIPSEATIPIPPQFSTFVTYLAENNYKLNVVGLPKTIDNDEVPLIQQSLRCLDCCRGRSLLFPQRRRRTQCKPRMLIVHEVMAEPAQSQTPTYCQGLSRSNSINKLFFLEPVSHASQRCTRRLYSRNEIDT